MKEELAARMARPQRHRLLQGFPAVPLMRPAAAKEGTRGVDGALWRGSERVEAPFVDVDRSRALIVGIIPHTMCTPKVRGCGFCTFPQDRLRPQSMREATLDGARHCDDVKQLAPELAGRRVDAIYFGGGTANLTPTAQLDELWAKVAAAFDVGGAEVTLEGVPSLFLPRALGLFGEDRVSWLASLPARHKRVSMGIQTFDAAWIEKMGREKFGDRATVARVVRAAHAAGLTTSGDFLFNLPGQTQRAMLDDVAAAVATGLDQICVYHLVLYEGLGTAWSRDKAMLAALPSSEQACESFLAVRDALLASGYVQTTLTNFEKRDARERFRYEELSFSPFTTDAFGIGPLSISTLVDARQKRAVKSMRARHEHGGLWFPYEAADLALLCFVRSLARLEVARAPFREWFGTDFVDDNAAIFAAAAAAGLVEIDAASLKLTPRGMFFSDAIVGLVTAARAAEVRPAALGVHTQSLVREQYDFMG